MNRIILFLVIVLVGAASYADYTVTTYQPWYNPQVAGYPAVQPYDTQQYNQGYYQNPYNAYNPYQAQCVNPYLYHRPYGYRSGLPYNALPSVVSGVGTGTTGGASQIAKNIGQSMLYSMMRGY